MHPLLISLLIIGIQVTQHLSNLDLEPLSPDQIRLIHCCMQCNYKLEVLEDNNGLPNPILLCMYESGSICKAEERLKQLSDS